MRFLAVVAGLLVSSACNGAGAPAGPPDDEPGGDPGSDPGGDPPTGGDPDAIAPAFDLLQPGFARDRGCPHAACRALALAASRIAALQADTIGDNAGNGLVDSDPDDGGWDFIVAPTATEHTAARSPTNLFGAIGLAAWAAVVTGSAGDRAQTAALDAGLGMQRDPDIDSAPDFVFGALFAELAGSPGFADTARAHYDARIAAQGGASALAALVRDSRHAGHQDGLIPYDLGWYILGASALDAAFPGAGYDQDATTYAKIVVDDLASATPFFDFRDPAEGSYTTGVAWALVATAWLDMRDLFRQVRAQLLSLQHADGAWAAGGATPGDDLQATAHALQTLAMTDTLSPEAAAAQRSAASWLLHSQAASGGWVDAANHELPLVDADIAIGLYLAGPLASDD